MAQRRWRPTLTALDPRRGMTLAELIIVVAVIGMVAIVSIPAMLDYFRTAALKTGTRELATVVNLARQLAVSRKTSVCVDVIGAEMRLRLGGCQGPMWIGPVTDGTGVVRLSGSAILEVASTARVVFTALGAATPSGTYRVTDSRTRASRAVVVAASGRVSVE